MHNYLNLFIGLFCLAGWLFINQYLIAGKVRKSNWWPAVWLGSALLAGISLQNLFIFFVPHAA